MNSIVWNPWHGCEKYSEGCLNCYVYRRDGSVGRDATRVEKNANFDLPLRREGGVIRAAVGRDVGQGVHQRLEEGAGEASSACRTQGARSSRRDGGS